jgi:hypothetical protein
MFSIPVIFHRLLYIAAILALLALLASPTAGQPAEQPELYGAGTDVKGNPTYFRVRTPSVTAVDIGPDAFSSTPAPLPVAGSIPLFGVPEGWTYVPGTANLAGTWFYTVGYDATAQGRMPRLFGFYIRDQFGNLLNYSGVLGLEMPLAFAEGPAILEGLFTAPSETGDLYGYGTNAKRQFTYFRFTLEEAEAADIGGKAFPFPLDAAYDPVHDVRYSVGEAPGSSWPAPINTLYVSDGRTGQTAEMGTLSESVAFFPDPALAYQASTGLLYAASWNTNIGEPLLRIDLTSLGVTDVGQLAAQDIPSLCWNPQTGGLYGPDTDPDFPVFSLMRLDTETGLPPKIVLAFDQLWAWGEPVFDATGRYLYVAGYQYEAFGTQPPHLLVYDLESTPDSHGYVEPIVSAPLPNLTAYYPGPSINSLFFSTPPAKGVHH